MSREKYKAFRHRALDRSSALVAQAQAERRDLTPSEEREYQSCISQAKTARNLEEQETEALIGGSGHADPDPLLTFAGVVRHIAGFRGRLDNAREAAKASGASAHVQRALQASVLGGGGALIPEELSSDVIELLSPAVAIRRLNPEIRPMTAGMNWPKLTGGATVGYLTEGQLVPVTEFQFGNLKLSAKKLAALVPISNDVLRYGSGADAIIRGHLVDCMTAAENISFLRSEGLGGSPKGLRWWAPPSNVLACNTTVNLANIAQDLSRAQLALMNANARMLRPGWMMAPRTQVYLQNLRDGNGNKAFPEMERGTLNGYPFATTTAVPVNLGTDGNESEVYLADFADVIIGEVRGLIVDNSGDTAYRNADGNLVSAFSMDQTVIRIIALHDIGMRHSESIAVLTGVKWF